MAEAEDQTVERVVGQPSDVSIMLTEDLIRTQSLRIVLAEGFLLWPLISAQIILVPYFLEDGNEWKLARLLVPSYLLIFAFIVVATLIYDRYKSMLEYIGHEGAAKYIAEQERLVSLRIFSLAFTLTVFFPLLVEKIESNKRRWVDAMSVLAVGSLIDAVFTGASTRYEVDKVNSMGVELMHFGPGKTAIAIVFNCINSLLLFCFWIILGLKLDGEIERGWDIVFIPVYVSIPFQLWKAISSTCMNDEYGAHPLLNSITLPFSVVLGTVFIALITVTLDNGNYSWYEVFAPLFVACSMPIITTVKFIMEIQQSGDD